MRKTIIFTLFIAISLTITLAIAIPTNPEPIYGSNYESVCDKTSCQATLYSYEKYFERSGEWEEIDEGWHSCEEGYCTNEYYFRVAADSSGRISSFYDDKNLTYRLNNFLDEDLSFSPEINGNVLTYHDIFFGVDLRYVYFPTRLKEEIVINEPLQDLPAEDFEIVFEKSGDANFFVEESTICDANENCLVLDSSVGDNGISLGIPRNFLDDPETVYPVVIDPTITLNSSFISWNGRVTSKVCEDPDNCDPPFYPRTSNPLTLILGTHSTGLARGAIEWNISSISDDSNIYNATLQLFIESTTSSNFLNITHMEKNNSDYSNNDTGNENFYSDMSNGTVFSYNSSFSGSNFFMNLSFNSYGVEAVEEALAQNLFSVGLNPNLQKAITISARDNSNTTRRPRLIIVYGVNELIGDSAIEVGINHSLPSNPILSGQKIYLVNENGQHFQGKFDKSTTSGNQTWIFKYVTHGESLTNIPSLFRILNTWENRSLSYDEIVSQVENFINATKY